MGGALETGENYREKLIPWSQGLFARNLEVSVSAALQHALIFGMKLMVWGEFPVSRGREFAARRRDIFGAGREDRRDLARRPGKNADARCVASPDDSESGASRPITASFSDTPAIPPRS
jgi:hypothetical protein